MNYRRKLVIALGAGTLAAPLACLAQQQGKLWRVGWLGTGVGRTDFTDIFVNELRSLGYAEGRNLMIDYRFAAGNEERLQAQAGELVALKVDVIVSVAQGTYAAKRATNTIPIVMTANPDPVATGLIASLARPGGNVTGTTFLSSDLAGKRLQTLREILPGISRIATLGTKIPGDPFKFVHEQLQAAARQLGITLFRHLENQAEALWDAFAAMRKEQAQALFVSVGPFTNDNRKRIVQLAAQHRLPALYETREYVRDGGFLSYGPNVQALFRRSAFYVDRILKGAKPADLPVEQPTIFEMAINLDTAKALGIQFPKTVLARADEVIE